MSHGDEEQPLTGGNVSAGVVRAGDTVRRPAGPWTPAVHALLGHLHASGPGSRLWDLAYAVHGFVPLSVNPAWQRSDSGTGTRLRLFADAYGLDEAQRRSLVPLLARRTRSMHDFLREQAARGVRPRSALWAEGHGAAWLADAEYTTRREGL